MSVDYVPLAGLGIELVDFLEEHELCMEHLLDEELKDTKYIWGSAGNCYDPNDDLRYYVFIPGPINDKDWANVPKERDKLLKFLEDHGMETKGKFGIVEDMLVF